MTITPVPTRDSSSPPEEGKTKNKLAFRIEDRRCSAQNEGAIAAMVEDQRKYPSYVMELQAQKNLAEKRLAEKVQWIDEEVARIRERLAREQDRKVDAEKRKIVQGFLEIADDFERALAAAESNHNPDRLLDGLKLIQSSLLAKLEQLGVETLEIEGQPFDPNLCEAVIVEEVDTPEKDQTVLGIIENGYQMGAQLLRPAKVRVGRFPG